MSQLRIVPPSLLQVGGQPSSLSSKRLVGLGLGIGECRVVVLKEDGVHGSGTHALVASMEA